MRILLIEDEAALAMTLKDGLEAAHFAVDWEANGGDGLERARGGGYDLILLDVMLPGRDGWDICASLRRRRDMTPILMLTARDSVDDRVRGLETGADDYLSKPFEFKELKARIQALLRRNRVNRGRIIQVGDLEIDTERRRVTRGQVEIALSPREYTLLEALAQSEGIALSRERILERVWRDEDTASNTVEVYIWALRKKIDADPARPKLIRTVHGVGYLLKGPDAP